LIFCEVHLKVLPQVISLGDEPLYTPRHCGALFWEYKALFWEYRALFWEYRALFWEYRALF